MGDELLISQVKPDTSSWTCRIIVVEKQNTKEARFSPTKFKPFILMDNVGNRVQATAFNTDIEGIDQRLKLYSTYLVSNAYIKEPTDTRYCVDQNYKYVWSFTRRTLIQDVQDEDDANLRRLAETDTKPFNDFFDCYLNNERFNVLAAVVCKLPRNFIVTDEKQKPAWDFVIVDEYCTPIVVTLWADFVAHQGSVIESQLQQGQYPLVLIKRAAATICQDLSLSTRFDTHIEINPGGLRATLLREWLSKSKMTIEKLITEKKYNSAISLIAKPLQQVKSSISSLALDLNKAQIAWISGKLRLTDTSEVGFYIGCDYCNRKVNSTEGIEFECLHCGQKNGKTVKRFRVSAALYVGEDQVSITLFTNDVNELLKYTGMLGNETIDLHELDTKLQEVHVIAGIRRSRKESDGPNTNPYSLVCVCRDTNLMVNTPVIEPTEAPTSSQGIKRKLNFKLLGDIATETSISASITDSVVPSDEDEPLAKMKLRKNRNLK